MLTSVLSTLQLMQIGAAMAIAFPVMVVERRAIYRVHPRPSVNLAGRRITGRINTGWSPVIGI
jgi:hypothetical protein